MQRHAAFRRALEDFLRANGQLPEGEKQLYRYPWNPMEVRHGNERTC